VVTSVVQLARAMDLNVIAEGVETDEQIAHLSRLGVDAVQGFGLSRPLSAKDLAGELAAHAFSGAARH
jgi:diguanylate cyclase